MTEGAEVEKLSGIAKGCWNGDKSVLTLVVIYGQEVRYAARGHAYRDVGGRPRLEQAVEDARSRDGQEVRYAARGHACMDAGGRPRLEQAVEVVDGVWNRPSRRPAAARRKPASDHFVIPAKAGIQWSVSSIPACRQAGMTTGMTTERGYPAKPAIHSPLGLRLLDSSFRCNDGGVDYDSRLSLAGGPE